MNGASWCCLVLGVCPQNARQTDTGASLSYLTFYRRVIYLKCSNQILWNLKEAQNCGWNVMKRTHHSGERGML